MGCNAAHAAVGLSLLAGTASMPAAAAGQVYDCVIETRCQSTGCETPAEPIAFGLHIDSAGVQIMDAARSRSGYGLPTLAGTPPEGMRVFAGPDGNGYALLSLRTDGAVTLSVHAGRMAGAPNNDSTLAIGRCEEPA